jgi:Phage protein Gp138 N-terminal domain
MNNGNNYAYESGGFERSQEMSGTNLALGLRVAMPGEVKAFDAQRQTVSVQPMVAQLLGDGSMRSYPLLLDVPVYCQRGGKFVATMPIAAGDPCLVIFADRCIDGWFSNGTESEPADYRMHDLSDGFALVGFAPVPAAVANYSASSAELRSLDGTQSVKLDPDGTITNKNGAGSTVLSPSGAFTINAPAGITCNGNLFLNGDMATAPGYGGTGKMTLAATIHATDLVTPSVPSHDQHHHADPQGGNVGPPF